MHFFSNIMIKNIIDAKSLEESKSMMKKQEEEILKYLKHLKKFLQMEKTVDPMFHDFPIFSRFSDQRTTSQLASTSNGSKSTVPPRLPHDLAPPDAAGPLLPHKDIMSNFPTLPAGVLTVGDYSDKAPGKKRHNVILCGASGKSVGASL